MSSHRRAVLLLVLTVLVAYANSLRNEFVWDDVSSVQRNPYVQHVRYLPRLFVTDQHIVGRGQGNFYRPLVSVSFVADYALWGSTHPFGYHLTNVIMHMAVVVCLYAVYVRVCGAGRLIPTIAAALYAVLPAHTEAVTYISGRGDMLVALFGLGALLALGKSHDGERPARWCAVSLCLLAVAFLSKELAAVFPVLILATDLVVGLSPPGKTRRLYHVCSFGLLAIYFVLRMTVLRFGTAPPAQAMGMLERIGTALQTLSLYAGILLWPVGLHMERSVGPLSPLLIASGALVVTAAAAGIVWGYRKDRRLLLGIVWSALAVTPVSGLFPLNAPLAEHWLYVPAMGLALAATVIGVRLAVTLGPGSAPDRMSRPAWRTVVSVACLVVFVMVKATAVQNRVWRDNETLFLHTLRYAPESVRVHYNLAVLYDTQRRFPEAAQRYAETIRLDPTHLYARLDLAGLATKLGRNDEAAQLYRQVIELHPADPDSIEAYVNLGVLLYNSGQEDEARALWDRARAVAGADGSRRAFVENAVANTLERRK